jgi:beta-carotene 3-hydroxylase
VTLTAVLARIAVTLFSFLFMEFVAWFTHKYVMHGFLWVLHKDHHMPDHKKLERNDLFAPLFALPSIILIAVGVSANFNLLFFAGLGIAFYGLAYFWFHDIIVHQRLNVLSKYRSKYLDSIIAAHLDHHRGRGNYGFLFMVPTRYFSGDTAATKSSSD